MFKFVLILLSTLILDAKFLNVNLNYFDWSKEAEDKSKKGDFSYIGFEGGMKLDTISLYSFVNIENPSHSYSDDIPDDLRITGMLDVDVEIKNNFKLHIQNFALHSRIFYVNDLVLGIGYKYSSNFGLWLRPYIGLHHTYDTYYSGINGFMSGWLFNYDFKVYTYNFTLFQWNEIEFCRDKSFYLNDKNEAIGNGASWGLNGAISLWMHLNKSITVGTQYRYAKNKLGYKMYQAGLIYTVKYNF